jgi:hypothetical protein
MYAQKLGPGFMSQFPSTEVPRQTISAPGDRLDREGDAALPFHNYLRQNGAIPQRIGRIESCWGPEPRGTCGESPRRRQRRQRFADPQEGGSDVLHRSTRRCRPVAILATIALTLLLAAPARADTDPRLRVMTYNLYLGVDLQPIITAPPDQVLTEAREAWHHIRATNFRLRAEAIADLITEEGPHLAGLQEVAQWQTAPIDDPTHLTTKYDFLELLLDELEQNGTPYDAVAENPFFVAMAPVSEDKLVRFTDRNVIVAPSGQDEETFAVSNPVSVVYWRGSR